MPAFSQVDKVYRGSNLVDKVYRGSEVVWALAVPGFVWDGNFIDGFPEFIAVYQPHTAYSLNQVDTNSGTDTGATLDSGATYAQAAAAQFANYGIDAPVDFPNNAVADLYSFTDAAIMVYFPAPIGRTAGRALVNKGATTQAQFGYCWEDGTSWYLGIGSAVDSVVTAFEASASPLSEGWHAISFQWHDNAGGWTLWADGIKLATEARPTILRFGTADGSLGKLLASTPRNIVNIKTVVPDPLIANAVVHSNTADDIPASNTTAGAGDLWHLNYFKAHSGEGIPIQAYGGTVSVPGDGYVYHAFTESGTLIPIADPVEVEYLVVAGGGGGGGGSTNAVGGGGGAGGLHQGTWAIASSQIITIGAGGPSAGAVDIPTTGSDSSIGLIVAAGGGGGGPRYADAASGGSGGGGSSTTGFFAGSGIAGQGFDGGVGGGGSADSSGGGGGGASETGFDAVPPVAGGGGDGIEWPTASGNFYAGGGGGATRQTVAGGGVNGAGGIGGGGAGAGRSGEVPLEPSEPGVANTGGGGGGGGISMLPSVGGSGITIVRYPVDYAWAGIYESFNGPDDLASIDADLTWTITSGSFRLLTNAAQTTGTVMSNRAIANPAIGSDLVYAQVECNTGNAAFGCGPLLCHNNSGGTGYYAELHDADNKVYINKSNVKVANANMVVNSNTDYLVRIEMRGGEIRVLVDGVEMVTYTDASPLTGAYAGIQNYSAGSSFMRFDNFVAGEL